MRLLRTFCLLLTGWLATHPAAAQNLVPNGDFELRVRPPCTLTRFGENISVFIRDWYSPTGGTPDYWSTDRAISTLCSQLLYPTMIQPHSGRHYAGIYTYFTGLVPYREYLQIKLLEPLVKGQTYRVEYWANLPNTARTPMGDILSNAATNNLGTYFLAEPLIVRETTSYQYGKPLTVKPQLNNPDLITGGSGWERVQKCFVAQDADRYLTIGNFFDDVQTQISPLQYGGAAVMGSYVLLDDVLVERVANPPAAPNLPTDTTFCDSRAVTFVLPDTLNTTYAWQNGTQRPRITVGPPGRYFVTASRAGCSVSDTMLVRRELPITLLPDTLICDGEPLTLDATHPVGRYSWNTGATTPTLRVETSGLYSVSIPSRFCSLIDSVRVTVLNCAALAPNVFTPNGDGKNDVFFVEKQPELVWQLAVYDRRGQAVYQSDAYANDWAGTDLPSGTYFYILQNQRYRRSFKGWVQLVR